MTGSATPRQPRGPKAWCLPSGSFGKVGAKVERREWQPPNGKDPVEVAQYRAAVIQNAIAVHVREFKNGALMSRRALAQLDYRAYSWDLWNARLNGTENLTPADLATLMATLPDALPDKTFVLDFLRVAEGGARPDDWPYPDTCNGHLDPQPLPPIY